MALQHGPIVIINMLFFSHQCTCYMTNDVATNKSISYIYIYTLETNMKLHVVD